jgi:hypothetical protein
MRTYRDTTTSMGLESSRAGCTSLWLHARLCGPDAAHARRADGERIPKPRHAATASTYTSTTFQAKYTSTCDGIPGYGEQVSSVRLNLARTFARSCNRWEFKLSEPTCTSTCDVFSWLPQWTAWEPRHVYTRFSTLPTSIQPCQARMKQCVCGCLPMFFPPNILTVNSEDGEETDCNTQH